MGWSRSDSSDAGRDRFAGTKNLRVHSIGTDAPSGQARSQVTQKCGWAAQVEIGIARHTKLLERAHVKVAGSIEVGAKLVLWTRPAVTYVTPAVRQPPQQAP